MRIARLVCLALFAAAAANVPQVPKPPLYSAGRPSEPSGLQHRDIDPDDLPSLHEIDGRVGQ
jgi:hypothetical protein